MTRKHGNKVANGVLWSAIERFSVQGIQFLLSIFIARLISPSDYGLIAMLGIFLAVAQQFVDSGFSNALVQKKDRSEVDFSTVFYANLVIAVAVYAALYAAAPWIADFYSTPKLEAVTKWVGLTVVLMAFSIVQRAKLTIELDFKTQAKISLVSVFVSGACGIVMAWRGYGVWALVVQTLANNFLNSLLLWTFAKWKLQPVFSWTSFRTLFSFGSKLLGVGLLHVLYANIYTLIIGKKFNASDVGYFNRSQTLAMFPSTNISSIITRALYPVQCEIQDDRQALQKSLLQYIRLSAYVIFPLMTALCVLAKPIIQVILTDKWLPAAELLSILSLAYMIDPVRSMNWQILNVKGRSDLSLKVEILSKTVSLLILLITLPFGLKAMCWGILLSGVTDVLIMAPFVKKVIGQNPWSQLRAIFPTIALTAASGIAMYITASCVAPAAGKLLGGLLAGGISYIAFSHWFGFKEFKMIRTIVAEKLG